MKTILAIVLCQAVCLVLLALTVVKLMRVVSLFREWALSHAKLQELLRDRVDKIDDRLLCVEMPEFREALEAKQARDSAEREPQK